MCGIAGFYGQFLTPTHRQALLQRMIDTLRHRGPDEQGVYLDDRAALAHARLSIIDLSTGQQPMANEDESVWVTFNGEIFNYLELHDDLVARGHRFHTKSDTETILHMYEEKGPACPEAFNGDFAFAVWDKRQNQLLLARDRMGVRPLYYTFHQNTLFFASEIKALLQIPGLQPKLDLHALDQCFTFWFPLVPRTPFVGIHELPPGHVLIARGQHIDVKRYWQLQYPNAGDEPQRNENEAAEELLALLVDATRIRLRADVPVGAYLSGGLDSSAVTALIRRFTSNTLRTFSVGFEHPEFDETPYQQEMVRALQTDHTSITCRTQDIGQMFPEVIRHAERPILRTAPAPLFALAHLVRDSGFKVVLTGEGADEVFAGYDIFKEDKIRRFWARQPKSTRRPLLLRRLYPYLGALQGQPRAYLEAFFGSGLEHPGHPFFSHLPRWNMTSRLKAFYSDDLKSELAGYDAIEDLHAQLPADYGRWHPLSRAQYLEAAYLLPGYILSSQGDRVSMAHAVEGRFPFLDPRVIHLAAHLPPRLKIKSLREKHLLRMSLARHLPSSISNRPKQPYRAPDSQSFFGPAAPAYVRELLSPEAIGRTGYFDARAVEKLVAKCCSAGALGFRDNMAVVGILSVQLLDHWFIRSASALAGKT